jgi:hypothetical protein
VSNQAVTWALGVDTGNPSTKVLLIVLANYADQDHECYPGIDRLARETDMSPSTVKRHMARLIELGHVSRTARGDGFEGGRMSNKYTLAMPVKAQSDPKGGRGLGVKKGGVRGQSEGGLGSLLTPEPSLTVSNQKSAQDEARNEAAVASSQALFDEFWKAYPKKVSKVDARRRWDQLIRRGVDPVEVIAAAKVYALAVRSSEKRFIKGPDGWLHGGRWEDEVELPVPELDELGYAR